MKCPHTTCMDTWISPKIVGFHMHLSEFVFLYVFVTSMSKSEAANHFCWVPDSIRCGPKSWDSWIRNPNGMFIIIIIIIIIIIVIFIILVILLLIILIMLLFVVVRCYNSLKTSKELNMDLFKRSMDSVQKANDGGGKLGQEQRGRLPT